MRTLRSVLIHATDRPLLLRQFGLLLKAKVRHNIASGVAGYELLEVIGSAGNLTQNTCKAHGLFAVQSRHIHSSGTRISHKTILAVSGVEVFCKGLCVNAFVNR